MSYANGVVHLHRHLAMQQYAGSPSGSFDRTLGIDTVYWHLNQ
jgi:hypothetical protein